MNIAYLTNMLSCPSYGGGSVHVYQIASRLIANNHKLYTNLADEDDEFVKLDNKEFQSRGKEIDVFYIRIHGHPGNDELTLLRKHNKAAPCVWEINAPLEELRTNGISELDLRQLNERRIQLAQLVDAALCVSGEMEEYAKLVLGIKKTYVIPNGSDPKLFNPEKRDVNFYDTSKFNVLWSGSTKYSWQGYKTVQRVAKELQNIDGNIFFIVTGCGSTGDNISFIDCVPYIEMPKYMASVDVGLCIYEEIDFFKHFFFSPLKLYDYMASGIPVIGSNVGQIKKVIDENDNGLLTDTSVEDLIDKILYLKNNRDLCLEMGQNGRKAVLNYYNWDRVVSQIESVLTKVIKEKESPIRNDEPVSCKSTQRHRQSVRVSIIICTYNRSGLLRDSIESVMTQYFPIDQFEIVIVDNNSTDDTANVIMEIAKVSVVKIKYIVETKQGLSYARNTGVKNAEGEIVIFTDDDIEAEKLWLKELVSAFDDSNVACVGGPIRPIWPFEKPSWIDKDWLIEPLSISEFAVAKETGYFVGCYPFGANIGFRKDVFAQFGKFSVGLGRQAGRLLSNEEIELCQRIEAAGKLIRFTPNAIIYHKIAPDRLTKHWFYRRFYWQGRSDAVLDSNLGKNVYERLRHCARSIVTRASKDAPVNFDEKCRNRWAKGYLHQLLFPSNSGETDNTLRPMRALEALMGMVVESSPSSVKLLGNKNSEQIRCLEERMSALLNSKSWRITAPLRALNKRLTNEK